jgi:hypothetical protein
MDQPKYKLCDRGIWHMDYADSKGNPKQKDVPCVVLDHEDNGVLHIYTLEKGKNSYNRCHTIFTSSFTLSRENVKQEKDDDI